MTPLPMSAAAAGLLRALYARASIEHHRILLTHHRSIDWQSLTLVGERYEMRFRATGPSAERLFEIFTSGVEEAEFDIPRWIVADISVEPPADRAQDGSICFGIEALMIEE